MSRKRWFENQTYTQDYTAKIVETFQGSYKLSCDQMLDMKQTQN